MLNDYMKSLGYKEEEINSVKNSYPLCINTKETLYKKIKENFNYLSSLGYTKEEIIDMTKKTPQIYSLNKETLTQKLENIISLGYSKKDAIKISKTHPAIYCYAWKT